MGYDSNCHWEDSKDELVRAAYGVSLIEFVDVVRSDETVVWCHPAYPGQLRTAKEIGGTLFTVAFEEIDDGFGFFVRIITAWPSTTTERNYYEENQR